MPPIPKSCPPGKIKAPSSLPSDPCPPLSLFARPRPRLATKNDICGLAIISLVRRHAFVLFSPLVPSPSVMRAIREGTALRITGPVWYDVFLAVTMRDAGVSAIVTEDITHYQRFPFVSAVGIDEEAGK